MVSMASAPRRVPSSLSEVHRWPRVEMDRTITLLGTSPPFVSSTRKRCIVCATCPRSQRIKSNGSRKFYKLRNAQANGNLTRVR